VTLTESLIELFSRGGPVMFGIAGVSLVAWFLSLRTWLLAGSLLKRLQEMSLKGLGLTQHDSPAGSRSPDTGFADSFSASYDLRGSAIKAQTARLGDGLRLVGTLAAVLPLLGLLGTVLGMLLSFEVIQVHGTSQPRLLAGGIGQALITTQAGLWTAVPVFFFQHIIRRRVRLIRNETEVWFHLMQARFGNRAAAGTIELLSKGIRAT
jgi:biopolymer transport protein ExbB